VLTTALLLWTRLHGLVSLEIGQHLQATGVDPACCSRPSSITSCA
jgi:hypothetical protein